MTEIEKVMAAGSRDALVKKIDSLLWSIKCAAEGNFRDAGAIKPQRVRAELKRVHEMADEVEAYLVAYEKVKPA